MDPCLKVSKTLQTKSTSFPLNASFFCLLLDLLESLLKCLCDFQDLDQSLMLPIFPPSNYLPASPEVAIDPEVDYTQKIPMKTLPSPRFLLRHWVSYVHKIIDPCEIVMCPLF